MRLSLLAATLPESASCALTMYISSPVKPPKTVFVCQECGGQQQKWVGRCPDCGAWNSLGRRAARPSDGARCGESSLRPGLGRRGRQALQRHPDVRCAANFVGRRGVRSRAWRRHRARRPRAARRRAGHRQVHAAAAGGGARCADGRSGALQLGRGIRTSDQAARRTACGRSLAALSARRNVPRAHSRGDRAAQAGARRSSIRFRRFFRRGFNPLRAASARCAKWRRTCCSPPRAAMCRSCSSGTSRKTAISPAPKRWSTSSIPFCTSRGSGTMRTASCARSRTASGPQTSWGCSR